MFNYKLHYKEGRQNLVADGLSRQFDEEPRSIKEPERLKINEELNYLEESSSVQRMRSRMRCELLSANECTEVQSAILDEIKLCQQKDTQCRRIIDGKLNRNDERFNFTVENNIVYSNQRYFIPNNATLKNKLLQLYHDRLGHQGVPRLLN